MRHWFQIPNLLTYIRLGLTPFVVQAVLGREHTRALVLCSAAAITDALDGRLARRFGWSTRIGGYLDPIADKVFLSAIFLALGYTGKLPWWLVVLVFSRDALIVVITAYSLLLTTFRDFSPTLWGKTCTAFQTITVVLAVLANASRLQMIDVWLGVAVWITAAATVWSGLHYAVRHVMMLRRAQTRKSL